MENEVFTRKQIRNLVIPLVIEQLLASLMGTADTMMVSAAGSAAISAVSLVDAINVLIIHVFSALAAGGSIICAQYLGRGERGEANETGRQLILSVTLLSTVVMIAFIALRAPMLRLIFGSVEPDVMSNAQIYLLITALSYPFIALYNAGAALFRVDGNSRLPMTVSTICNLINIGGNALLIFTFKMGAAGAALSTLASRVLSGVAVMYFLRQEGRTIVVRDYFSIRPQPKRIWNIMAVGVPTGVENGMFQFGKLVIQSTVSTLGTVAIAAQAMTQTLELLASNAAMGVGIALMTVAGRLLGAGMIAEARVATRRLCIWAEGTVVVMCALIALGVEPLTRLCGMEPQAAAMTVRLTLIICAVKPIVWMTSFIPAYALRAAGDVRFTMLVSSITMWSCRVVVATVLMRAFHTGPLGVWIGMFADWSVRSVIFLLRLHGDRWTHKRVIDS